MSDYIIYDIWTSLSRALLLWSASHYYCNTALCQSSDVQIACIYTRSYGL